MNTTEPDYREDIRKKYDEMERARHKASSKWQQLNEILLKSVAVANTKPKDKHGSITDLVDKFKANTRMFINEDVDTQAIHDTAFYLFQLFYFKLCINDQHSNTDQQFDLYKTLRQIYPQCVKDLVQNTLAIVDDLVGRMVNRQIVDDFLLNDNDGLDDRMFGENYDYIDSDIYPEIIANFVPIDYDFGDDDDDATEYNEDDLHFQFPTLTTEEKQQRDKTDNNATDVNNLQWVQYFDKDVSQIIYEALVSPKSNDALQNDLLEMVGFEHCDLIEILLTNRSQIVRSYENTYIDVSKQGRHSTTTTTKKAYSNSSTAVTSQALAVTSGISVQLKSEKQIMKLIRKEEKRLNRITKTNEQIELEREFNFNPTELKKLREEQLHEARLLHLYNRNKPASAYKKPTEIYPHVFDSFLKATQTQACVAGSKILLPENIVRIDDRISEEIRIPAAGTVDASIKDSKLVDVRLLDDIGKIAFRNVKFLNRIQSIVFETAYYTNENLLICAPTGAGKTNIAMLTIVNEINKNFEMGVLKKDNFKIVYVAPMKALAAEMVENFSKCLEPLGIVVKELTGDMQLTKKEVLETQILVTTPEKWDVVTRKSLGDISLSLLVRLLIIDEVHLLHDDRGSVIETIVARTLRQVESSQKMIRIVGLSATLPNYLDVARFLNVNPYNGLFFFDGRFRPVPLEQTFIGIKSTNKMIQMQNTDDVCYEKCLKLVKNNHQVLVFVHARNATIKTATKLRDTAKSQGDIMHFYPEQTKAFGETQKTMERSKNKQLRDIFNDGFAVHHAGMLRQDRNLVEKAFKDGHIRVLVCTATLAWGVNLPAHAVIIKGTEIYDSKKGSFVDISMLDILQIFGRAGRPQYDSSGEAFILTTHDKLSHYLSLLTRQTPIESQFVNSLADNLNAEICLGTVATIDEGAKWLSYTYLYVRMRYNPMIYGITYRTLEHDPTLVQHRCDLIQIAARNLDKAKMIRYDEKTGYLHATDLGRTASHYYIKYDTVEIINEKLRLDLSEKDIFSLISNSTEFQQLKVRDEEMQEMDSLYSDCPLPIAVGIENTTGKVNLLIQSFISRYRLDGFSLVSDMAYVSQNVGRIARALFEIVLKRGWPLMSGRLLNVCKTIEKRLWHFQSPMRQFEMQLQFDILNKIEDKKLTLDKLRELDAKDLGILLHNQKMCEKIKECVANVPYLDIETSIHPITRSVLRVKLTLTSNFKWNDKLHGTSESFWVWIEDPDNNHIYHHEYFTLQRKHAKTREPQLLVFTIPIFDPLPSQYIVRVISDKWMGVELSHAITFQHLILPEKHPPHTELLDLDPLPVEALGNSDFQALYKFSHFNPIQTQIFHCLYHTDRNCLIGAPTGSGKTVTAEIAMFRVFNVTPQKKCVYIAPLKALVRERMTDWKQRLEMRLNKKVVELTGDVAPDMKMVAEADVIVTTPEKWDGISRSWQTRNYVKEVALIVIDEIHLLGEDRGPVLEVIVSRTNFISSHTNLAVRIIGLSTAIANARDLADWLGIKNMGLYNFKPSVRPVPLEVHIQGFAGKHYCPRMATMNKPCFQEIRTHSPDKPVLIFVSSRRQTRVTAIDLISYLAHEPNPKQWLHMSENEISNLVSQIVDQNLKLTLTFGIGIHHAGLNDRDRRVVEELFVNQRIQILIATSTLAWGVNFPAHLVIVKGTEFYDGKTKRYVDFPITDVLQMMGRAGRPQYDDQGFAVIMVHDVKKHFYKKFLYEPFPVESCLLSVLPDHLNAEIVAGTISSKQESMDYLTWTYFFRRLLVNPTYYQLDEMDNDNINRYLSKLIQQSVATLQTSYCVAVDDDGKLDPTTSGRIASFYYLTHTTLKLFNETIKDNLGLDDLIDILSLASEYDQLPVRHNEDTINADLSKEVPIKVNQYSFDSPHTKCNLLLQAHYSRLRLPSSDYITDLKTVMDQCLRILQAMLDFSADSGYLTTSLSVIHLMQMTCQGRWLTDSDLLSLPHIGTEHLSRFYGNIPRIDCLPVLMDVFGKMQNRLLNDMLGDLLQPAQIEEIEQVISRLPQIEMSFSLTGEFPNSQNKVPLKHGQGQVLYVDQDYTLNIDLNRLNRIKTKESKAYAPCFAKPKDENWIAVLANCQQNELIALKRIGSSMKSRQGVNVLFSTQTTGKQTYTLFFMSDVYVGLDQQYEFNFDVIAKA